MMRIGILVALIMLALLAGVGATAPAAAPAAGFPRRITFTLHSGPGALWVCLPGRRRCRHMLMHQP
jgi:hypothetical protein